MVFFSYTLFSWFPFACLIKGRCAHFPFSSLSIFKTVVLKSLSHKSDVWASSGIVSAHLSGPLNFYQVFWGFFFLPCFVVFYCWKLYIWILCCHKLIWQGKIRIFTFPKICWAFVVVVGFWRLWLPVCWLFEQFFAVMFLDVCGDCYLFMASCT